MSEKAVQKYEAQGAVGRPIDIEALFREAIGRGKEGVEVMERLMSMRKELNAEQSKAACDEAIRLFQRKCPPIGKTKGVPDKFGNIAYRYTPLETIIKAIAPIMDECGLSYSFDTDVTSQNGWVIAICEIAHVAGHSFKKQAKFPLGTKTNIMSDTQQYSAALSFATRRVLCNALGIVTVGEDQDGGQPASGQRGPSGKSVEPEPEKKPEPAGANPAEMARKKLWGLLKAVRGDGASWFTASQWLKANKIITDGQSVSKLTLAEIEETFNRASIVLEEQKGDA